MRVCSLFCFLFACFFLFVVVVVIVLLSFFLFDDLLEDRPLQAEGAFLHN